MARVEVCGKCGKEWNVSVQAKIPKGKSYICPRCEKKERAKWARVLIFGTATFLFAQLGFAISYVLENSRGYKALGGEMLLILIPLLWILGQDTIKEYIKILKGIKNE